MNDPLRIISLASGSKGNAYLVGTGGVWLLIDEGLSYRMFKERAAAVFPDGLPPLAGILITHAHVDHTGGLEVLLKHCETTVYANAATVDNIRCYQKIDIDRFACFENGQDFDVGPFCVHPFSIPHDTSDPVGYLVRSGGETYFHGTDIGTPLDAIGVKLAEADAATLESNHDPVMLRTSNRPATLIQRIAGPRGHLSNEQASGLVARFASAKLKRLGLAHLSQDCNTPAFAEDAMRATLAEMNRSDIALKVYAQDSVVELTR